MLMNLTLKLNECLLFQLEICGCENGGNCTTEGTTPSSNPRILNCLCPQGIHLYSALFNC